MKTTCENLKRMKTMMYNMTFNLTKADLEKIIKDAILKQNPNLDITSVSFNIGTSGDYRDSYSVVTGANVVAKPKNP